MQKVDDEQQNQVNQSQPLATERSETLRAAQGDGQSCVAGREVAVEYLTQANARLAKGEYFDHVNDCGEKVVNWIRGDAFCPECGEMGTVYQTHNEPERETETQQG